MVAALHYIAPTSWRRNTIEELSADLDEAAVQVWTIPRRDAPQIMRPHGISQFEEHNAPSFVQHVLHKGPGQTLSIIQVPKYNCTHREILNTFRLVCTDTMPSCGYQGFIPHSFENFSGREVPTLIVRWQPQQRPSTIESRCQGAYM